MLVFIISVVRRKIQKQNTSSFVLELSLLFMGYMYNYFTSTGEGIQSWNTVYVKTWMRARNIMEGWT